MTKHLLLFIFTIGFIAHNSKAQPTLVAQPESVNQIPDLITLSASATHLYVLSESDGLVVFRTNSDTLQYIFTSEGMQMRGHTLISDVRFAYQFGQGNRLTVIEPTSLLGVYSSTNLSHRPLSVTRVSTTLYVAAGPGGLLSLPLDSPSAFDTTPGQVNIPGTNSDVIDVISFTNMVYTLHKDGSLSELRIDENELQFSKTFPTGINEARGLYQINGQLYAGNSTGELYLIQSNGDSIIKAVFDGEIAKIEKWNEHHIVRSKSGLLFLLNANGSVVSLLSDSNTGNHFAVANNSLWVANFDILSNFKFSASTYQTNSTASNSQFDLNPIPNQIVTFPRVVLIPIETTGIDPNQVRFQLESKVDNAQIRGNGFYWQPSLNQTGLHEFTINAISSNGQTIQRSFIVDVRSFNSPPRFNPTRPITITVGENFTLPVKAIDTDGVDQNLIRYHGVDLPEGSSISERTGMFSWTPDRRQVGDHEFRVIATDQFGAATSQTISITVRNLSRN